MSAAAVVPTRHASGESHKVILIPAPTTTLPPSDLFIQSLCVLSYWIRYLVSFSAIYCSDTLHKSLVVSSTEIKKTRNSNKIYLAGLCCGVTNFLQNSYLFCLSLGTLLLFLCISFFWILCIICFYMTQLPN